MSDELKNYESLSGRARTIIRQNLMDVLKM